MASKYVGLMIIPALAFLVTVIIGQYRGDPIVHSSNLESVGRWISTYVIEVLPLFWPLLILRIAIGTQFVKRLPNATARNRAALCALISLSIPYVFAFAYLPLLIVAAPASPGQGMGILLALVATPIAGALAFVGWKIALRFSGS